MRCLLVLPTYNEAANIDEVLSRVTTAAPVDVLVVDDGSPDGTADLAAAFGAANGRVEVLRRPAKAGLGSAYRAGFRHGLATGYDVMLEMDADLQHDPNAVPDLIAAIESGANLAVGSRYMPGGEIPQWPWYRRAISRYGNLYARAVLAISTHDATSGFRAYRDRALRAIDLDGVRADGYGFQIEMAYLVERAVGGVVEVPITFRERQRGESKMSSRIVVEALALVTWWGVRDRIFRRRRTPRR